MFIFACITRKQMESNNMLDVQLCIYALTLDQLVFAYVILCLMYG